MTLVAKPVIDKQYWILRDNETKVGNIEASDSGYTVKLGNKIHRYTTISLARSAANIEFADAPVVSPVPENQAYGYDTGVRVFNAVWDVKRRLPLFTKEESSKSWHAAGWYRVRQHRNWKTVQNPKLITLQRYAYQGPFHSQKEANEAKT